NKTSGVLNIANSTFFNNTAADSGGAIFSNVGVVTISGSTFTNNSVTSSAGGAGAIETLSGGTLTVTNSVFDGNTSGGDAGAIIVQSPSTVTNSRFKNNIAKTGRGGGILTTSALTVVNSTFDGNAAGTGGAGAFGTGGGGIYAEFDACTVVNSTFSNNSAPTDHGGAIHATNNDTLTVTNSTLSGNAAMSGGGISLDFSTLSIGNTIVALNPTLSTPDVVEFGSGSTLQDRGHNLIGNPGALIFNHPGDSTGQNPLLDALMDNGGTTATLLPDGAHALTRAITTSSPAFNHGDPAICTAPLPPTGTGAGSMDERGFPRGNGVAGNATCSIGAFELYVVKPNPAPTPRPGGVIPGSMPKPLPPQLRSGGVLPGVTPAPAPVPRR
ncbi:MAG: hypothetical protein M3Y58_07595, partial [Chloroflexota bacterium]|nr:hypothetical protein [Chloroflexota bacterium]